jgi:nitrogen fixation protein FixH
MKRGAWWPVAIGGVLAVTVVANVYMLRAASAPGATATEPDSYRRAMAWDSLSAEAARSAAIGWSADAQLARAGDRVRIEVRLRDAAGAPVRNANVSVIAIHNLESTRRTSFALVAVGDHYAGLLPSGRAGLWELRITALRGADRWVNTVRRDAPERRS